MVSCQLHYTTKVVFMPFLSAEILNYQGSTHFIGVGSLSNLYQPSATYAVIKEGNKRATKIFDTSQDAENYISQNANYKIEIRQPPASNYMQYIRGFSTIKDSLNLSPEQCIELIPYWIRYIKYCKRQEEKF